MISQLVALTEKRKSPRSDKKILLIIRSRPTGGVLECTITTSKNTSSSGVLFAYKKPLHHGTPLYIRLHLLGQCVDCAATVQRSTKDVFGPITNVAVSFKDLPKADRDLITNHTCV